MSGRPRPEPRALHLLRLAVTALGKVEMVVAVVALTSATIIGVAQIALRYATAQSFWWGQEVSIMLMLVAYFVGGSVVYRLRYDVVVGFVTDRFAPRLRRPLFIVVQLLILAFWATLAWQVFRMIPSGLKSYTVIMRIPKALAMLPLLYASFSITLTTIYVLLAQVLDSDREPAGSLDDMDDRIRSRLSGTPVS